MAKKIWIAINTPSEYEVSLADPFEDFCHFMSNDTLVRWQEFVIIPIDDDTLIEGK